jgi:outer membrane protein assembly factor BamE (lipoprotein component of BamABCDE complex)
VIACRVNLNAAREGQMVKRSALFLLLAALLLGGCSWLGFPPQIRGNKVDADAIKELVPGTSTRTDVTSLLGSPTAKASFDDNTWLSISEVTQPRVAQMQGVNSQNVVEVTFNDQGILQSVKQLTAEDAKPVAVVSRTTPSPGSDATFMQQLLGNVGRFNAGPSLGQGTSTTLGAK